MNIWILLVGVVLVAYLGRYDKLKAVDYNNLLLTDKETDSPIAGKRILVLGPDKHYYLNNKSATAFINWDLAKDTFENPDLYETVTDVYSSFRNDPPDIIIDKENLLPPFLERLPEFKKQFRREGNVYSRIKS